MAMIHRVTFVLCFVAAVGAAAYASATLSMAFGFSLLVAAAQVGVYGVIAAYAWVCRRNIAGSWIVLFTALLELLLTLGLLAFLSSPAKFGAGTWGGFILWTQALLALFGGYLGYACVESRRLRDFNPGDARGKLAVVGLLALGIAAVVLAALRL